MLKVKLKKPIKIKRFKFKRANWPSLNIDLNNIDCISVLDCMDPDQAWIKFKDTLNHFLDIYISKVTTKLNSQPPWFDTECYLKCKEKERLHKKCNSTKSIADELKFTLCRKEFKSLIKTKMRDNLYCSNNRSDICKQFWSHVRTKSKSCRIPEILKQNCTISSHTTTKANMFNQMQPNEIWQDHKLRDYKQTARTVLILPYLIVSYFSINKIEMYISQMCLSGRKISMN